MCSAVGAVASSEGKRVVRKNEGQRLAVIRAWIASVDRQALLVWSIFGLFLAVLCLVCSTCALYWSAESKLESSPADRVVSEVTRLYPTQVARVATPRSTAEIAELVKSTNGPLSIGGARCSQGGQIAEPGSLHLDLRQFNRVLDLDVERRQVTVQAGISWRDLQEVIDPHDLSIRIMQTYANFSVGGSLSVNAHGRYMGRGPVVQSVRSFRLVLASGQVKTASRDENAELFYGAIGGYGGIGVIAEATLSLDENVKVKRSTQLLSTASYSKYFREHVRDDPAVVFHNADLHPPDFDTARAVSWLQTDEPLTDETRLIPRGQQYPWTSRIINDLFEIPLGHRLRKNVVEPLFYRGARVIWRNHEASYDIQELEPKSRANTTYALREYFVPAEAFDAFVPKMRAIFSGHKVPIINVSVRHASADPGTLLAWARGETFAFVVYYQQGTSASERKKVAKWSRAMVDAVLSVGGTYYLPYQNHPTLDQFERAYPRHDEFFALKRKVDPLLRFQNSLFYKYGPSPRRARDTVLAALGYEKKPEAQTVLTIPEWYLVFNPIEYAEHLEAGRPADAFPFRQSVVEYMSLYKRVLSATAGVYPENPEYVTMLRVIGASTAVEYQVKGAYEATVGRLFRALSSGRQSPEDRLIARAHRAYADLLFDEPWYEFEFLPWVSKIWRETPLLGSDLLRRTERKLAFSAEFLVKAIYGRLLGWAAESAYGEAQDQVHVVLKGDGSLTNSVEVLGAIPGPMNAPSGAATSPSLTRLVSLGRWGEFSQRVPALAADGFDFVEIAGNDDIVVTLVEPQASSWSSQLGRRLFRSRLVSRPERQRSVWMVPVPDLGAFLRQLDAPAAHAAGIRFEHIYDY